MKKYAFFALCAALVTASCEKENDILNEAPPATKMITVSCSIADTDPNSKVTLTNDGSVGKTEWEATDVVLFHGQKMGAADTKVYSYSTTPSSLSADKKTAYFTIPDLDSKYSGGDSYRSSIFALYPASAVADYNNGDDWYYLSCFKNTNHLLMAACNDTSVDSGTSFTFYHLTGALSFTVDGSSFGGFDKYVFKGNNGETIGWSHYSVSFSVLKKGTETETRYLYSGSNGPGATSGSHNTITVTPTNPNWDNGTTVNTVFFPGIGPSSSSKNAAVFSAGFSIIFYKNDIEVKRVSTKSAKSIPIGNLLDLGDITSNLYTYSPPSPHNNTIGVNIATAIDLSADIKGGPANCYIVEKTLHGLETIAGQSFKFKATMGKGGNVIKGGKASLNIGGDEDKDVVVLWETLNTTTAPATGGIIESVDYDLQDGGDPYIVFKIPVPEAPATINYGNALIAAKNSNGDILWSWHIWVPETEIQSGKYLGESAPTIMDRNLGSLVVAGSGDVRANGLMYQWGRKDPFLGRGVLDSSTPAVVAGTSITYSDTELTYDQAKKNPTKFSLAKTGSKYHWINTYDNTLWGASKTVNDPCPPGWRVPTRDESNLGLFKTDYASASAYTYDSSNLCVTIGTAVFPCNGRLRYDTGGLDDRTYMFLWSAKCGDNGLARWVRATPSACTYADERAACAVGVRCIAE